MLLELSRIEGRVGQGASEDGVEKLGWYGCAGGRRRTCALKARLLLLLACPVRFCGGAAGCDVKLSWGMSSSSSLMEGRVLHEPSEKELLVDYWHGGVP